MTIPSHLHTNYSETPCTFFVNNNGQKDVVGAADAPSKRQRLHAVLIGLNVLYEQLNVWRLSLRIIFTGLLLDLMYISETNKKSNSVYSQGLDWMSEACLMNWYLFCDANRKTKLTARRQLDRCYHPMEPPVDVHWAQRSGKQGSSLWSIGTTRTELSGFWPNTHAALTKCPKYELWNSSFKNHTVFRKAARAVYCLTSHPQEFYC